MVIEDDANFREQVTELLKRYEYDVYAVNDFKNVLTEVDCIIPDLVILDINLSYFDGNYYCRLIRKKYRMPIIVTSARDGDLDQILSMELESDDYIIKPFNIQVLISRVAACLRRTHGKYNKKMNEVKGLTLDEDGMKLMYKGKSVDLSKTA